MQKKKIQRKRILFPVREKVLDRIYHIHTIKVIFFVLSVTPILKKAKNQQLQLGGKLFAARSRQILSFITYDGNVPTKNCFISHFIPVFVFFCFGAMFDVVDPSVHPPAAQCV